MKDKSNFILFFFVPFFTNYLLAQNANLYKGGATTASIGGISSIIKGQDAIYHNPAGTTEFKKKTAFDLSYENRYGIAGLNDIGIGVLYKKGFSNFSLNLSQYGIESYKEQNLGLGYARQLIENLSVGIKANYNSLKITDYGSTNYFSFDIGFQSKINRQLSLGGYINNFLQSENKSDNSPTSIALGLAYAPSEKVTLMTEFLKVTDRPLSPKLAIIYKIQKSIELRLGSDITKGEIGFGLGYNIKSYLLRFGYVTHQSLNGSYSITVQGAF
jgi:hypothetical protein